MLQSQCRMLLACAATCAVLLAGCSASTNSNTNTNTAIGATNPGGSSGGGGQNPIFNVQVNFTGTVPIQGSFVDHDTGSGYQSCSQFASMNTPLGWLGPAPSASTTTQIGGKIVSWLMSVPKSSFHGAGTYSGNVITALAIGSDDFTGSNSQVTLNGDGSGSGSFTSLSAFTSNAIYSGTITWTCSG